MGVGLGAVVGGWAGGSWVRMGVVWGGPGQF